MWGIVKWGTFALALIALFGEKGFNGDLWLRILCGFTTVFAAISLTSGKQNLIDTLDAVGIINPMQSVAIGAFGLGYFFAASAGLWAIALDLRPLLGATAAAILWALGSLSFALAGVCIAFSPNPPDS